MYVCALRIGRCVQGSEQSNSVSITRFCFLFSEKFMNNSLQATRHNRNVLPSRVSRPVNGTVFFSCRLLKRKFHSRLYWSFNLIKARVL